MVDIVVIVMFSSQWNGFLPWRQSPYNFPSKLVKNEAGVKGENPYNFPAELMKSNFESSGYPYKDPTTLAKGTIFMHAEVKSPCQISNLFVVLKR